MLGAGSAGVSKFSKVISKTGEVPPQRKGLMGVTFLRSNKDKTTPLCVSWIQDAGLGWNKRQGARERVLGAILHR
jgi:hypothetical protein